MNTFEAQPRTEKGTQASRRLRNNKRVPAIIYGGHQDPVAITIDHDELFHLTETDEFFNQPIHIKIGNEEEKVWIKDLHRHPYKEKILHADFIRL